MSSPSGDIENQQQQQQRESPPAAGAAATSPPARFSPLAVVGFGFLTFNSATAIYRSGDDPIAICSVAFSYIALVLLFELFRRHDGGGGGGADSRRLLMRCVWLLTTLLTLMFSYKVAAIMPLAMAAVVCVMAVAAIAGLFWAFGCFEERRRRPVG